MEKYLPFRSAHNSHVMREKNIAKSIHKSHVMCQKTSAKSAAKSRVICAYYNSNIKYLNNMSAPSICQHVHGMSWLSCIISFHFHPHSKCWRCQLVWRGDDLYLPWWSMSVQTRSIGFLWDSCCVCRFRLFPKARLQLGTFVQEVIWRKIQLQGRIWAQLLRRTGMGTQDTAGNAQQFYKVKFHTNWQVLPLGMGEDYPGKLFLDNTWYWLGTCWKWFGGPT